VRSDLQNLTGVIINVLGCDTILSGRFTAYILKEPAAPPPATSYPKATSTFMVAKEGSSRFFWSTNIYPPDNAPAHPKKY